MRVPFRAQHPFDLCANFKRYGHEFEIGAALTEGIDAPDRTLHKDLVFVQRDQSAYECALISISVSITFDYIAYTHPVLKELATGK